MRNERESWRVHLILHCIILLSVLLAWATLTRGHDWGGDFAGYLLQAHGLAEGDTGRVLERLRFTMEHSSQSMGPIAYPWGYPIILSAIQLVSGFDLTAFKLAGILCFALFLVCLFHLFSHSLSPPQRLILVAIFAFNPHLIGFLDNILSDIPFLLISTFSFLLIERIVVQRLTLVSMTADRVLLGAMLFTAFLIRRNGLLLLPALLVAEVLVARRRLTPGSGIPHVVFGTLFLAVSRWLPPDASNLMGGWIDAISIDMLRSNVIYFLFLPSMVLGGGWFGVILQVMVLPFGIAAAVKNYRREGHVLVYVALTMGLYVMWPYIPPVRFIYSVLPFLFYLIILGMFGLRWRVGKIAVLVILNGLIALSLWSSAQSAYLNLKNDRAIEGPFDPVSRAMFDHVSSSTEPESVIVFYKPRVMTLMTGRRSIMVYRDEQLERGDYLVYDRGFNLEQPSDATVQAMFAGGVLRPRFENQGFIVFEIVGSR